MALEFESMVASGRFSDGCELPILDLRPHFPDEVLANIPRYFYRWEDGNTQEILLDENYSSEAAASACGFVTFSSEITGCTILIPNQKRIAAGIDGVDYQQLLKKFCKARHIQRQPTLFNSDGTFNMGAPLAGQFLEYLFSDLKNKYMSYFRDKAWNGDQSTQDELHGILTQLDTPLVPSGVDGCELYEPVEINWSTLTGTGGSTATAPTATIDAASDTVTIHGVDFDGMTGLNMGDFLVLWIERLMEHDLAAFAEAGVEFELWVGRGQTTCIANMAACMQPCDGCVNPLSDPNIRARAAEFRKEKVIWLYPYDNVPITIRQSPVLTDQMILVPKMIGGRPTIAWIFRDQDEQQMILNGELPYYGARPGSPEYSALYPPDEVDDAMPFEQRAFSVNVQKDHNCIDYWMNSESAVVISAMHLWMRFSYVDCAGLVPELYDDLGVVASVCAPVGGEDKQLDLTVAALEDYGAVSAGDTYIVYFEDGYTALIGTVVSYDTGTDVLRLSFVPDVDCNTGGGAANATVVKHSET